MGGRECADPVAVGGVFGQRATGVHDRVLGVAADVQDANRHLSLSSISLTLVVAALHKNSSYRPVVRQAHYERGLLSLDIRPLPCGKRSGRVLGGYPQAPTVEGSALSGLSCRMVDRSPAGSGARGCWGVSASPHRRGLRPLWTLPSDGRPIPRREAEREGVGGVPPSPHRRGLRPLRTLLPDGRPIPGGKRSGRVLGGIPKPPP